MRSKAPAKSWASFGPDGGFKRTLSAWIVRLGLWLAACLSQADGASFSEWSQRQPIDVPTAGWVKVALTPEMIDALRPGMEDLRLATESGVEVPYLLERPAPQPPRARRVKGFQVSLQSGSTLLTLETGLDEPMDAVTLETPEMRFIKATRVEGSRDGRVYQVLREGAPVFRQAVASDMTLRFEPGVWPWMRVTVDDSRSAPVPFLGATVHGSVGVSAPVEPVGAEARAREEVDGDTRWVLDLGAANLTVATVTFETPEPVFSREVEVLASELAGEEIREVKLGRGTIYALDTGSGRAVRHLRLALERQVPGRELIVVVRNWDSPPLALATVGVTRRPVWMIFQASQAGRHWLMAGQAWGSAPRYDLSAWSRQLKSAVLPLIPAGGLEANPDYHPPEGVPGLAELAGAIDVAGWRFRKQLTLDRPGAHQWELDLDVLAGARRDLADLRLVREERQVPYLVERSSLKRSLQPEVTPEPDPQRPRLSRWKLTLPRPNLPVDKLECRALTPLFQRNVRLWEKVPDGRGGTFQRDLGQATWQQAVGAKESRFLISLQDRPRSTTFYLETDNGDNPPLELDRFRLLYPVSRVVFQASAPPALYYGNATVSAPRYDVSLAAPRLLRAPKSLASAGPEEVLSKSPWTEGVALTGVWLWLFWGVLVVVVAGLLILIARLLPKPPPTTP